MNEQQLRLVKASWRKLMSFDAAMLGDLFYTKLFTDHPGLRKMFPKDMNEQNKKLIDMITVIVGGWDWQNGPSQDVIQMGKRHIQYGVKPTHYDMVGQSLIWTLAQGMGSDWTDELQSAWLACYKSLSSAMLTSDASYEN